MQPDPGPDGARGQASASAHDRRRMGGGEMTALLAMVMSMVALAIDILLPAFADLRRDFGLAPDSTAAAGLITTFFLGLAASQIVFGVLSDRFGRKPILWVGLGIYVAGAVAAALAPSLGWLLGARFVWGLGAASPRILTLSVLRDTYSGERMARAMSFVMAIFILVPVLAPSLGAALTSWVGWRGTVWFTVAFAVAIACWTIRLPETLRPEHRLTLNWSGVAASWRRVITNRQTMGCSLAFTALFGAFASYLATSELIYSDIYGRAAEFPIIFGAHGAAMGLAILLNGSVVERVGLRRSIRLTMLGYLIAAAGLVTLSSQTGGTPPFWAFTIAFGGLLVLHALLIPNLNSAAMLPMASVAGTASAIIGTMTIAVGAMIGALIDRAYDGTVLPLVGSCLVLGMAAWAAIRWAEPAAVATEEAACAPGG